METGSSARRVAHHPGHSDFTVRRCWDQWTRERSVMWEPDSRQDTIRRQIVEKTVTSYETLASVNCLIVHYPYIGSTYTTGLCVSTQHHKVLCRKTVAIVVPITCTASHNHSLSLLFGVE
ncbi:hypothetical protein TNCV_496271 [Trichonephila clavipes]|nr:hypothetical protein TNCV_496271 [Trichonephila clavipes]